MRGCTALGMLLLAGLSLSSVAQGPPPHELQGKVVSARAWASDPPIAGARVRLEDSDSEALSDGNGLYQLPLPPGLKPGDPVTLTVSAPGYVIYTPAGGRTKIPPPAPERPANADLEWTRVTIRLLRKGSAALLEDPQIEALLGDLGGVSFRGEELTDALQSDAGTAAPFELSLQDWAASRGLPYEQVDKRVRAWSEETYAHREGASPLQQGEAALGARRYEEAGNILAGAAAAIRQAEEHRRSPALEEVRKALSERLALYARSAAARDSARLFEEARQVALQGVQDAQAEAHRYSQDAQLRHLWWGSSLVACYQRLRFIQQAAPLSERQGAASTLLADCRALRGQITQEEAPRLWGWSNLLTAIVTGYLGEVSGGQPALEWLDQAIADAGRAAAFYGKDRDPQSWAAAQTLAGRLLQLKAAQAGVAPQDAAQWLAQSRAALLPVLEVYTQEDHPRQWAEIRKLLDHGVSLGARAAPAQRAEAEIRASVGF